MCGEEARTWRHEEDGDDDEREDDEDDQNRDDDALPVALLRVGAHQLLQPKTKSHQALASHKHILTCENELCRRRISSAKTMMTSDELLCVDTRKNSGSQLFSQIALKTIEEINEEEVICNLMRVP